MVESEAAKKQQCIDAGCEVTTLTDEQIQAFKDLPSVQDYYAEMKAQYGAEACAAFGIE